MLKQFVLFFTVILFTHPVWSQAVSARVQFNKNASSISGIIPAGSEGDYVSASFIPATAERPARYMVKVRVTKIPAGQESKVRPGQDVWVYHSAQDNALGFKDLRGQMISNVENTLFKGTAILPVTNINSKDKKTTVNSSRATPPAPASPSAPPAAAPSVVPPKARETVDPNLARSTDRRKTEADFCPTGRCVSGKAEEIEEIQEITKQINKQYTGSAQAAWANDPVISGYSKNSRVLNMIKEAKNRSYKRSTGKCYRYVKTAALRADIVDYRPPGAKAIDGIQDLKTQGWTNLMDSPKYKNLIKDPDDAPKGAILVYRNTRNSRHPGHIEIKTDNGDKGGYVSDFYRDTDTSLVNRELVGVMIKENL